MTYILQETKQTMLTAKLSLLSIVLAVILVSVTHAYGFGYRLLHNYRQRHALMALIIAMVLCVSFAASPSLAEDGTQILAMGEQEGTLVVNAAGFKHERGQAVANLFREGDDVLKKPYLKVAVKISEGKATMVFPNIKYGNYAVSIFHDENANDQLDHNIFRFPAEPLGFSNGFKLALFSGLPSFEKLRFVFQAGAKPPEITVK